MFRALCVLFVVWCLLVVCCRAWFDVLVFVVRLILLAVICLMFVDCCLLFSVR